MNYPLAPQGVFRTIQGEGTLLGLPMVFVRFAGCPVGCPSCDTNYTVNTRVSLTELVRMVVSEATPVTKYVWLTGGEPTIHELNPLIHELHKVGFRVALATAGINPVHRGWQFENNAVDFLSVSPHRMDSSWVQRRGEQVNLVFGLNGLTPEEAQPHVDELRDGFADCWVTPCEGDSDSLQQCLEFVDRNRGFRLSIQAHKQWNLP